MTTESLEELKDRASALQTEITTLAELENPSPGDQERMQRQCRAAEKLAEQITTAREAEREKVRKYAAMPGHIEKEAEPAEFNINRAVNPWGDGDLRSRAQAALEVLVRSEDLAPADAERCEALVKADDGKLDAELLTIGSDPHYRSAFSKYLKGDRATFHLAFDRDEQQAFARMTQWSMRTALTTTSGSALIPVHLDPSINLTNTGSLNSMRRLARVETLTIGSAYHAVTSAGVTGEWRASENTEMADATPSVSDVTITPQSADVYVEASWEAVYDSGIENQLGTLFADAKDRLEATAFTTGSGSSGQPEGFVTKLGATTASRVVATTNGSFGSPDIYAMFKALPARYQPGAQWMAAYQFEADVRQFATGTGPQHAFWADFGQGTPPALLGKGWNGTTGMTSSLSAATASSDDILVLSDFRQAYLIADRQGSFIARNDMVVGSNRRPTGTTGFVFWWRTGGNTLNADAGRVLRV